MSPATQVMLRPPRRTILNFLSECRISSISPATWTIRSGGVCSFSFRIWIRSAGTTTRLAHPAEMSPFRSM